MDSFVVVITNAYRDGKLLDAIQNKLRENWENHDTLIAELTKLHNHRDIDLIASFSVLKNSPTSQLDFFLLRNVLEKSLPKLDAPVSKTMNCVANLVKEAGNDMMAGTLLPPFVDYCSANPSRPKDALKIIENLPEEYAALFTQVVIAGARLDIEFFLDEIVRFSRHENIELRRNSVFSLGRIKYPENSHIIEKAIICLEISVKNETDDRLLGALIDSAFNLYKQTQTQAERITNIVNKALSKGDDYTLHASSAIFGFGIKELPDILLDCLLSQLIRVKPENKGSLDNIDYGLTELIPRGNWKGVEFLENFLLSNSEKLTIDVFDSLMRELFKNQNNILNRLVTRWFIMGDRILCDGISEIAKLAHEGNIQLAVAPSDFDHSQPIHIIFLARKAIGYLFSTPVTAASILISLMHYASDKTTTEALINLLFDFLLINYPGAIRKYVTEKTAIESDGVKSSLETVVKLSNEYFENIKSTGIIPELHPSQSQRDTYRRRFSKIIEQAMRDAQKESVLLSLVSTSVLLYGRKSVNYAYGSDGQFNRMEFPLQPHSTEMEFPRVTNIDPFGLDYALRVFRAERISQ